jgi:hypothetical protein
LVAASFEKQLADDAANTVVLRDLAIAWRSIGWVHNDYIKTTAGQTRQAHIEAAKENYRLALDALLKTESQKALSETDRKNSAAGSQGGVRFISLRQQNRVDKA